MPRLATAPLLALALAGLLVAAPSATRQAPQTQPPTFRALTDIVRFDVTVLGPDGKPVHGLKREDFTVLEDGKPREILGFGEVNIPDASASPPWMRDAKPDVRGALDGRVIVFILDDAQTRLLDTPGWIKTVTRVTDEIIDRMGPQDVAAVICTYDNRCDQDFTTDHVRLKAAIGQFKPKEAYIALRVSAGVTQSLAKYLRTEPGRRRSIIYVTPQMPVRPSCWAPSAINPTADCSDDGSHALNRTRIMGSSEFGTWGGDDNITGQGILHTFEEAMRSGITVYGLNLRGLHALGTESPIDDLAAANRPGPAPGEPRFTAPPRSLAAETGGFVLSNPADLAEGAEQIITETGSYYLLGFESPDKAKTGYNMLNGFREVEVLVNQPNLIVRTHRGYIAVAPPKPASRPSPPATAALEGILPRTDLPLTVTAAPFAVPGDSKALVAIGIGVPESASGSRRMEQLEVQARAFTQDGRQRAGIIHKVESIVAATRRPDGRFDVIVQLRLKPGAYALRCSADNRTLGVTGSVYADVEVPDFAKAPLSLSGVLLQVTPAPTSVFGTGEILAGLPIAPTTQRTFAATNRLNAFLRVYQGSSVKPTAVSFTLQVLDEAGTSVYEQASTLGPALFARTRSADITVDVPVRQFKPGLHLLRIEATAAAGPTARRDVTFRIN